MSRPSASSAVRQALAAARSAVARLPAAEARHVVDEGPGGAVEIRDHLGRGTARLGAVGDEGRRLRLRGAPATGEVLRRAPDPRRPRRSLPRALELRPGGENRAARRGGGIDLPDDTGADGIGRGADAARRRQEHCHRQIEQDCEDGPRSARHTGRLPTLRREGRGTYQPDRVVEKGEKERVNARQIKTARLRTCYSRLDKRIDKA